VLSTRFARREYENYAEGEIAEMVEIYMNKGFSEEDARKIIGVYTSKEEYKDAFLNHMMVEELSYIVPGEDETQVMCISSGITGISFVLFGSLPLWMLVVLDSIGGFSLDTQIGLAALLTILSLFSLGIVKVSVLVCVCARVRGAKTGSQATITRELTDAWFNGLLMMVSGALAAGAAYLIGMGANSLLSHNVVCTIRMTPQ
jgi:vacuolar iron transporter family protein